MNAVPPPHNYMNTHRVDLMEEEEGEEVALDGTVEGSMLVDDEAHTGQKTYVCVRLQSNTHTRTRTCK